MEVAAAAAAAARSRMEFIDTLLLYLGEREAEAEQERPRMCFFWCPEKRERRAKDCLTGPTKARINHNARSSIRGAGAQLCSAGR